MGQQNMMHALGLIAALGAAQILIGAIILSSITVSSYAVMMLMGYRQ